MKKINVLILCFATTLSFLSCDKDDDTIENETNPIVGKWQLIGIVEDGEAEEMTECRKKSNFQFQADGTYKNEDIFYFETDDTCIDDGLSGTYTISGNQITFIENNPEGEETVTYKFQIEDSSFLLIDDEDGSIYVESYQKVN